MYKLSEQLKVETEYNNEGKESLFLKDLTDLDVKNPNIRMFSLAQLKPGEEVPFHVHEGESEAYYILSGQGIYNDNGTKVPAVPGMVTFTPSGEGHALKNTGEEMLSFIALIVLL